MEHGMPTATVVDDDGPVAEIFPSESACCRPGLGAFRHGCAGLLGLLETAAGP